VDGIFSRRLIIQSGKGGTGKTTISAALALAAANHGKRVLLVEVDTRDRFAALFGLKEPVGYEAKKLRDGVWGLNLDPELVVIDFFKTHVKFKTLYKQITESNLFKYFYEAAPGLKELICMGKVWRLVGERRALSSQPQWDCVILDAPATGHGISLLHIAQAATDLLFGPMKKNAEKIRDMLVDPRLTVLNLVAIPEEMPVNEAIDFHRLTVEQLKIPLGVVFMNAVMPPLFDEEEGTAFERATAPGHVDAQVARLLGGEEAAVAVARSARSREDRAGLAIRYEAKIREAIPLPLVPIPFVFDADFDQGTLEAVAREVEKAFAAPAAHPKKAAGREGSGEFPAARP
jgi:anion-transporting  ArsA/GET3 family ATPase